MRRITLILTILLLATSSIAAWGQDEPQSVTADDTQLLEELKTLYQNALSGDSESQYIMGRFYVQEQNFEKATEWIQKAAEQGHNEAQYFLGGCYFKGIGVLQDFEKAAEWFQKAAEQGHVEACDYLLACYYNLGVSCLIDTEVVQQDTEKALQWFQKAKAASNDRKSFYDNFFTVIEIHKDKIDTKALDMLLDDVVDESMPEDIRRYWLYCKGFCKLQKNDLKDAASYLNEVVEVSKIQKGYFDDIWIDTIYLLYLCNSANMPTEYYVDHLIDYETNAIIDYVGGDTIAAINLLSKSIRQFVEGFQIRDEVYIKYCNLLSHINIKQGNYGEALSCLRNMIVECDDLMDYFPQLAYHAYKLLHDIYSHNGAPEIADRVFYTKVLRYAIKFIHDASPGKSMKQISNDYDELISLYRGGQEDGDIDIIYQVGEYMLTVGHYKNAMCCYDDCIKKAQQLKSSQNLIGAYLGRINIAIQSPEYSWSFDSLYQEALQYTHEIDSVVGIRANEVLLESSIGIKLFLVGNDCRDTLLVAQKHFNNAKACLDINDPLRRIETEMSLALTELYLGDSKQLDVINKKLLKEVNDLTKQGNIDKKDCNALKEFAFLYVGKYFINKDDVDTAIGYLNQAKLYASIDEYYSILEAQREAFSRAEYSTNKRDFADELKEFEIKHLGVLQPETEIFLKQIEK